MRARTGVFLLLCGTLWTLALSTGLRAFHLGAAMLTGMAVIGLLSALTTLLTLRVDLIAPRRRVLRGDTVPVRVVIKRRSLVPVSLIEVDLASPDDGRSIGRMAISSASFRGREYRYTVACAHRGVYQVGLRRICVTDVFGLFSLSRAVRGRVVRLEVLPRAYDVAPLTLKPIDAGTQGRVRTTEDMASPSGVRAWQDGDSLKKVHWKLTARRHELLVRTFEETAKPDVLILLDCAGTGAMQSHVPTIEDALCEAAVSAARAQMRAGYQVRMPLNTERPTELAGQSEADMPRFLSELCWLRFDSPYQYEQVIMLEMRRLERTGALFLVSTRLNAALCDLVTRIAALGVSTEYIWVTDVERDEQKALCMRMAHAGISVRRVDPWADKDAQTDAAAAG